MDIANAKSGPDPERSGPVVLELEIGSLGDHWEARLSRTGKDVCLELVINGAVAHAVCGFDIPGTTEVGFVGGLRPGQGDFILFGLTSARVATVTAESAVQKSEVRTKELPPGASRSVLRFFVIVREPVENVDALVASDATGRVVQRLPLPRATD